MSEARVTAINEPGQKPVIPPEIEEAMKEKGIKTLRKLATRCGYNPMTIRRMFLPNHGHRMLVQYMRWGVALDLSLEELFSICLDNDAEEAGNLLAERISEQGFSLRKFSQELGNQSSGVGLSVYHYINGDADYQSMRIYRSISTELGITADKLATSIATTFRVLQTSQTDDTVLESRAPTFSESSKKAWHLRQGKRAA